MFIYFPCFKQNEDMEQLGQKLLCTTLELEKLKSEAMNEMQKNKEYINQLIRLLKFAIQERDEARTQFHKLLNQTSPLPDIPLFQPGNPNSSITESNTLSDPYGSSPYDVVSSPEFSNINVAAASQPLIPEIDHESLIIDSLAKGRVLPQKGKFLQAVLQAGPLLQPLMVAGPLPRWRNPPQMQPFQIPALSIKGSDGSTSVVSSQGFGPLKSQIQQSVPVLDFGNLGSGNCGGSSSGMNGGGILPFAKRQRFS